MPLKASESAMTSGTIERTPSNPTSDCIVLVLWGMFLLVAPLTEALKVLNGIVHIVSILVMNLALSCFSAPFTRRFRLQAFSGLTSPSARCRLSGWISNSAFMAAMNLLLKLVPSPCSCLRIRVVLLSWVEVTRARWASLGVVCVCH